MAGGSGDRTLEVGSQPAGGVEGTTMDQRCLIMADEPELLDAVLRLAAAACVEVQRAADPADARRWWAGAPMVLLEGEAARRCAAAGLPRRDGVVLVARGEPPGWVWQAAVTVGATEVVTLPEAEAWLVAALADSTDRSGSGRPGAVVAIVGARGGAGASTLAAATAVAAARSGTGTLLVDCDPLGGGLDLLLGVEQEPGLRWPELTVADGRVRAGALHDALPHAVVGGPDGRGLAVLSCARSAHGPERTAVAAVLEAGRRVGDTVVCDLPRYPTEAALAALGGADLVVLVVPADVRSCAAGGRVAQILAEHTAGVEVVVRGPSPGGITATEAARAVGLPLLTDMRPDGGLGHDTERGRPPGTGRGPLGAAAVVVLDRLAGARP
ncbi:septum site-determining protein Ssd [Pseudonocardia endophytica]|uniref:Secretion/DNA translocation related CpaE-like protein n=1 Tax=Pseudonocardia endophytica TaxID=401976 RepID=A0A4R1I1I9_PSEEN|nr:septum site-determining protein Ssd [Pseudonocardia endophytica]TCK27100.1 secretion/DNA translocation related CpaE-like protein [Pseudonocardia endophytica]